MASQLLWDRLSTRRQATSRKHPESSGNWQHWKPLWGSAAVSSTWEFNLWDPKTKDEFSIDTSAAINITENDLLQSAMIILAETPIRGALSVRTHRKAASHSSRKTTFTLRHPDILHLLNLSRLPWSINYAIHTAILLPQKTHVSSEGHNNYSQLNHKCITQKRSQNRCTKAYLTGNNEWWLY